MRSGTGTERPVGKEELAVLQRRLEEAFGSHAVSNSESPPQLPGSAAQGGVGRWIDEWRTQTAATGSAVSNNAAAVDAGKREFRAVRDAWSGDSASAAARPTKLPTAVYVSSLFINLLALALPLVLLQVYDRIIPNQAVPTLSFLVLGMAGVIMVDVAMKIARAYMVGWATAKHHYEVSQEAVRRILHAPAVVYEREKPAALLDRINALDTMRDFYGGQSRLLLLDLPFIVVFLGLLAFIGGPLVFVPIAMILVLGTLVVKRAQALREILTSRSEHDERRYDFIIEALNGIETVKSLAMEPQLQRRFERLQQRGAVASHDTILQGNMAQIIGNLFSSLTIIGTVTLGAALVLNQSLSLGALAACTLLSGRIVQPLLKGLGVWTQMQTISVAKKKVEELFELPEVPKAATQVPVTCEGAISLRNVAFRYGADKPDILKGINLEIAAGEMIGVRGVDGSGKTTFLKLITGELTPSEGTVAIDGHDVHSSTGEGYCRLVAHVPQIATLFQGTILENLTMFQTGEVVDHAREAARLIDLEADIHQLPEGYDTVINQGITTELPVGVMQRIGIARSLAQRPRVLLFDAANAYLDARADKCLRDGLQALKGTMTVILISERPSLLRLADRILDLRDGGLCETNSGEEPQEEVPALEAAAGEAS